MRQFIRRAGLVSVACGVVIACSSRDWSPGDPSPAPAPAEPQSAGASPVGTRGAVGLRVDDGHVRVGGDGWTWAMELTSWGRGGSLRAVPRRSAPSSAGARTVFSHDGVTEWYEPSLFGVEQGFSVAARPAGTGALRFELASEGAEEEAVGRNVALHGEGGETRGWLGALHAKDAKGRPLPARFEVEDGRVAIVVDDARAEYPIAIDPFVWQEQQKVFASDVGPTTFDAGFGPGQLIGQVFGGSVAVSNGTIFIGGGITDNNSIYEGGVYVLGLKGTKWTQQAEIHDGMTNVDGLGTSIAVSGNTILAGAPAVFNSGSGSAFVFVGSGASWTKQAWFTSRGIDGDAAPTSTLDLFGRAVALDGDTAAVGCPVCNTSSGTDSGTVEIYVRSGTTWTHQATLEQDPGAGQFGDFGMGVALRGNLLVVGSDQANTIWVSNRSGSTWSLPQPISPTDPNMGTLGPAVALDAAGTTLLVGAPQVNDATGASDNTGAVAVFTLSGSTWSQATTLTASNGAQNDNFGYSVALNGTTAVVGAPLANGVLGAVYAFSGSGANWTALPEITGVTTQTTNYFGAAVAMSGNLMVAGSPYDNTNVNDAGFTPQHGAAYVYLGGHTNGDACGANADCLSGFCVDGVCCNVACTGQCQACDLKGLAGTCSPVTGAPVAPRPACTNAGTTCGGTCNGTNTATCAYPTSATTCRNASCSNGVQTAAASCDGQGDCPAPVTTACTPYVCGSNACKTACTQDPDCISGDWCSAGKCVPQLANGTACSASDQCTSGNCVDGFCCNTACGQECQACNVSGSLGKCTTVTGKPVGSRPACGTASNDPTCGVESCNGTDPATCHPPPAGTTCGSAACTNDTQTAVGTCSGSGTCNQQKTVCAPYACGATSCDTACLTDKDCSTGNYCSNAKCVPQVGNGTACTASDQCANGNCVDGVCCDTACGGQCQACNVTGKVGTCSPVTGNPVGGRPACATDGTSCGGTCNGTTTATCTYPTSSCRNASCSGGTQTAAASCDGQGHCPAPVTKACTPYVCGANACKTSCGGDGDCVSGDWCNGGTCQARAQNGAACTNADGCVSGNCVDGVCCDTGCGGQCQACNLPGSAGKCSPVTGNPVGGRPACATDGSSCGGACNGTNTAACTYPTSQCRGASCANGTQTAAASCDGQGHCPAPVTTACTPYVCGTNACKSSCATDTDCIGGDWCSGGVCTPRATNGGACTAADQCSSGNCVDGVCCDTACGGQCQACNVSGSVGTCSPVTGAPVGGRPACTSDGSSCGGACNGVSVAACTYPTSSCRAASCTNGVETAAASCDGAGHCPAAVTTPCDPYVCGATACETSCQTNADCQSPTTCQGGVCKGTSPNGSTCTTVDDCASGNCVDGVCCDTACNGQCQACDVAGEKGTCSPVTGEPHGSRTACGTASNDPTCGPETCNGTDVSACHAPGAATACGAASCSGSTLTNVGACNGAGACNQTTTSCAPYVCSGTACKASCTVDTDCVSGDVCNGGVCGAPIPDAGQDSGPAPIDGGSDAAGDSGPSPSDAGGDAAPSPTGDAGSGDGGAPATQNGSSAGCGCAVPGERGGQDARALFGLAAVVVAVRRRRRVER
jgi:MYXO-CTERM domain-containing protein